MAKYEPLQVVVLNGDGAGCTDMAKAIKYVEGGGTGYPHMLSEGEKVIIVSSEIGSMGLEYLVLSISGKQQSVLESQIEGVA